MSTILVTDAEQRASLAVVRSLGRAGHEVHVTAMSERPLAGASRWCRSVWRVPDPMRDPVGNARAHATLVARLGVEICLPIAESTALVLLDTPPPGVRMPLPSRDAFRTVCDKAKVLAIAEQIGLRTPRQVVIERKADLARELSKGTINSLPTSMIVKPSRSIAGPRGQLLKLPVRYAEQLPELLSIVQQTPDAAFPLLLQERVQGEGLGVFVLLWDGREIALFGHRRIREKPPTGGVSTLRESVQVSSDLRAKSLALLRAVGVTHGVAMVEFKGERGEEPSLMEINGRFWGSLQLAVDAGVDFPALLVSLVLGRPVEQVESYRLGISSRWWWGDVDHLIARIRRGLDVRGAPASESPLAVIREVLFNAPSGQRDEIWRTDDARPFWRESLNWMLRR